MPTAYEVLVLFARIADMALLFSYTPNSAKIRQARAIITLRKICGNSDPSSEQ
jgi:hypothetical protein